MVPVICLLLDLWGESLLFYLALDWFVSEANSQNCHHYFLNIRCNFTFIRVQKVLPSHYTSQFHETVRYGHETTDNLHPYIFFCTITKYFKIILKK
jgi:hypothetical protein